MRKLITPIVPIVTLSVQKGMCQYILFDVGGVEIDNTAEGVEPDQIHLRAVLPPSKIEDWKKHTPPHI